MASEQGTDIKETSELYEHFIQNNFDVQDMVTSLELVLYCNDYIDLDVFFFAKGMLYSSIRNHSLEQQIEFMYHLDKLNLLNHFIPRYVDHLQSIQPSIYKSSLSLDLLVKNFHTISKTVDCRKPNQSNEYKSMWRQTNKRVNKFVKHGVGC